MQWKRSKKKKRLSAINIILILNSLHQNYCNGFELYVPFKIRFIWFARMLHNMIWIYELWAREWILFFYFIFTSSVFFFRFVLSHIIIRHSSDSSFVNVMAHLNFELGRTYVLNGFSLSIPGANVLWIFPTSHTVVRSVYVCVCLHSWTGFLRWIDK